MRALLVVVGVLVLAGCSLTGDDEGDGDATVTAQELEAAVLQPADMGRPFSVFDEGRQGIADRPSGARSSPERFGRTEGWKARYRRAGSRQTRGPIVVASLVDAFGTTDGAEDDFEALKADLEGGELAWKEAAAPELGDEAIARTLDEGNGVSFFLVAWRDANAVSSVEVNGFTGKVTLEDALALARKQARRVSEAAAA